MALQPGFTDKKRPTALNLTPTRSTSASSSSTNSLKLPRTPRFAEATSVHSPIGPVSPFSDPVKFQAVQSQPSDIGFGYINGNQTRPESVAVPATPMSPLRSAIKTPGTPGRQFNNPLSPTFREEEMLEKRELSTDKEQVKDVKMKTRVRMAKFALRGVSFSCSLIILSMLSASFSIFNATKSLPNQSNMPAWAPNTSAKAWPQKLALAMACLSLFVCIVVFAAYCRGGHKRAEKVNTYYQTFAVGWFITSLLLWVITAALFQHARDHGNNKDMWGWACVDNTRSDVFSQKVDYQLVCRLQNWSLVCIVIEIVIEVISIALYSIVFYRYYTKRRLFKSMDLRDRARSDLYLAQLRSQSAPNTPGFGGPKSPSLSHYAMSPRHPPAAYRNLSDIDEANPFTPGGHVVEPQSQFSAPLPGFKLQPPPTKAPSATPKMNQGAFAPAPEPAARTPASPTETMAEHAPGAAGEPTYEAVPIPGAYAGQAIKSPPPTATSFPRGY
ncbi:hypothetical protein L249_6984 [Ophiocordyceps polyrhachis-furcata BCC 54312]|uniref:MARVEL domain-containing protein n=1 Tax=Ophiocordyceps polyrhachis-furcata BCC 54312 TaxID=1330021 RepID=A0A367LMA1_9HYPO|nr:hypothetical protein L249_6984 [Ophiocordyceps polyrhachis-furcata BCC 54312]